MSHIEFYKELGKLLYAIANADGMLSEKDPSGLRKVIYEDLAPEETGTDDHGANEAWYTEYEFEVLQEYGIDVETAFDDFINYYREHKDEISREMKENCMRAATKIAQAFQTKNHFERYYLKKLRQELFGRTVLVKEPVEEFA